MFFIGRSAGIARGRVDTDPAYFFGFDDFSVSLLKKCAHEFVTMSFRLSHPDFFFLLWRLFRFAMNKCEQTCYKFGGKWTTENY